MEPFLCDGAWRDAAGAATFTALAPASGDALPHRFPVASRDELARMVAAASRAAADLRESRPDDVARFLELFATEIDSRGDELAEIAHLETALPLRPRLREVELVRTTTQLRQAAAAARQRSWAMATIDTTNRLRSAYFPLGGPVVVLGPNNFPLAFNGVSGGDFAAAVAAGNPVIAKAHPGHPATSKILAECALRALQQVPALPAAMVQMFYHCSDRDGLWLAGHPAVAAIAFTGSRAGGLRLKAAADAAGKPVYLEMSAVNPVFVLPGALRERGDAVVDEFVGSCLMGAGQFCTSPGLVLLRDDEAGRQLLARVGERLAAAPPGVLLSRQGVEQLTAAVAALQAAGAELCVGGAPAAGAGFRFANTLLRVGGGRFLAAPAALQTEAFGSAALFVFAADEDELVACAEQLHGSLTATIYSGAGAADAAAYARLAPILRQRAGRVLDDKMPTGVALSPAMNHGGPFPATGHPGFTAVGIPASLRRFAKLTCFDAVRPERLPELLADANPTGETWRLVDGTWTTARVRP